MNDPTILPISIILLILVSIAYYQRLYQIIGILVFSYIIYIGFVFYSSKETMTEAGEKSEVAAFDINEQELIESTITPVPTDTVIEKETLIEDRFMSAERISEAMETVQSPVSIRNIYICTDIDTRTPIGIGNVFPNDIQTLYCFTGISNPARERKQITHFWKYEDKFVAKVDMWIGTSWNWRCWSRVSIQPQWTGEWEVSILDSGGTSFGSITFNIIEVDSLLRPRSGL